MRRTSAGIAVVSLLAGWSLSGCSDHTERASGPSALGHDRSPGSSAPQGPSISSSPTVRKSGRLHPSPAFRMLPKGAPPRIPFLYGHTVIDADRRLSLPAPIASVSALTPVPGGWLVASRVGGDGRAPGMSTQGFSAVTRLGPSLRPLWTRWGGDLFATSGDGSRVAYFVVPDGAEPPGRLVLGHTSGGARRSWTIPFQRVAKPVGIGTGPSVVYNLTNARGAPAGVWSTGTRSAWRRVHRLPLDIADTATTDLVAGRLRSGCLVVLQGTTELWRRCAGLRAAAFSPDGRYLAAWHTETGGEFESAYVLDARTGRTVTTTAVGSPPEFHGMPSGEISWEDDQRLLIAFDDALSDDWEVLRLDVDGHLARATGAIRDRHTASAFVFGAG